jgi:tetratricopeptide (TPR) repeat protein
VKLAVALTLCSLTALAQVVPDRELEIVKATYDAGNYADALRRARDAMAVSNFSEAQRMELHKYAGLSAFNLGQTVDAQKHFLQLLQLNPDYVLDPFAVPPPVVKLFEQIRKDNADQLNLIRQQITLLADQQKRAEDERARLQRELEERRRRMEDASRGVRVVERRPWVVNLVPFGAGQFVQGRVTLGASLAAGEGVTLLMSLVSYFAYKTLVDQIRYEWRNRAVHDPAGTFQWDFTGIPAARLNEATVWKGINIGTGLGFVLLWGIGVVDAALHNQGDIALEPKPPPPAPGSPGTVPLSPEPTGAGLHLSF